MACRSLLGLVPAATLVQASVSPNVHCRVLFDLWEPFQAGLFPFLAHKCPRRKGAASVGAWGLPHTQGPSPGHPSCPSAHPHPPPQTDHSIGSGRGFCLGPGLKAFAGHLKLNLKFSSSKNALRPMTLCSGGSGQDTDAGTLGQRQRGCLAGNKYWPPGKAE